MIPRPRTERRIAFGMRDENRRGERRGGERQEQGDRKEKATAKNRIEAGCMRTVHQHDVNPNPQNPPPPR